MDPDSISASLGDETILLSEKKLAAIEVKIQKTNVELNSPTIEKEFVMLKKLLKSKYKALPPAEKFKRNLIGVAVWIAASLVGLLIFKSGSGLLGLSVIFIGAIGIIDSAIRALINLVRAKKQSGALPQ
ncbi:hypothetical protein NA655_13230 [Pseudomonas kuykendallii]|uniref:hypothetical protein n=1 Tax=Pseudomonas kuykendallii TaxID=1007099 RepID=UPI001113C998|nr:hypothetical protein [Pseudomonas kuykendallii]MCQ4271983.1 hypothetical protein [Pseudomonas kuykendallii]